MSADWNETLSECTTKRVLGGSPKNVQERGLGFGHVVPGT